ncbi:MAG: SseB family protein [Candidatus Methanoplasma sp.]|nr:SseB family protein [Candidatus Methanoplasma sp.]
MKKDDGSEIMLKDGKVLAELIDAYYKDNLTENLFSVLRCLRDSIIIIPVTMRMSDADRETSKNFMKAPKVGDILRFDDEVGMRPDFLKNSEGEMFFPIFGSMEEMPVEYATRFTMIVSPFVGWIDNILSTDRVAVLNGFTKSFVIEKWMLNVVKSLPRTIGEDEFVAYIDCRGDSAIHGDLEESKQEQQNAENDPSPETAKEITTDEQVLDRSKKKKEDDVPVVSAKDEKDNVKEEKISETDKIISDAKGGDINAQCRLAGMYFDGEGVRQSDGEAARWYLSAATAGNADAQYNYGLMNYYGRGVQPNNEVAAKWLRMAADQGHAEAQFNLGIMYTTKKLPRDDKEEFRLYMAAAKQGMADAQYNLGLLYSIGKGVKKDKEEATKWFEAAAEQGDPAAIKKLGKKWQKRK